MCNNKNKNAAHMVQGGLLHAPGVPAIVYSLFLLLASFVSAAVSPVWSSGVAVPGEQVVLYLVDAEVGQDTFALKEQPQARFASVRVQRPTVDANPLDPNRAMVEILPIIVRADKAGVVQLENVVVEYRSGRREQVKIPPLPVRSTADIKWYSSPITYGALWYTDTQEGYVHQPVRAALKIFLPQDCSAATLPQMNAVGVKISPMQVAVQGVVAMVHSRLMEAPSAFARGMTWNTADFTGEFTPFREGKSDIVGKLLVARRQSIFVLGQEEVPLPTLTLSALPLPPGAPADFADAVGRYTVSARTSATSLAMNEAVEVEITVRGTGSLQQLACPAPDDAADWKLVPATRKPIIAANGETVGMVFSQLMRPVAEVSAIPSFSLSYFDPTAMAYKKAATAPIVLPWHESEAAGAALVQAAAPPPAGVVPVAEMTDIYGFMSDGRSVYYVLPRGLWYLLYLPAVGILAFLLARALMRRAALRADDRARERELAALAREGDGLAFLKGIGAFIESHIPRQSMNADMQAILRQRDDEAFRPGAAPTVEEPQRAAMIKSVRKALAAMAGKAALLAMLLLPLAQAESAEVAPERAQRQAEAEQYYNARQYTKAQECLQGLISSDSMPNPADYYNLGNCYYRLGKPGQAALYYARALQANPSLAEARANLSFIQRKEGAILPIRSGVDSAFTLLSCRQRWVATIICTAALAFCIALALLLRGRKCPWLSAATALFAVLSLLCALDWVYYTTRETPDFSSLPPADIAYVVENATARTAAAADAASIIQLPPSTPVHLLACRGSWSYVQTTTGVRGWVESARVQPLMGSGSPRLPIILRFE